MSARVTRDEMNYPATHLSNDDMTRYCGRTMSAVELLAADDHLALCDMCHERLGATGLLDGTLLAASEAFNEATTAEVSHLTFEQLAALADNQLNEIDREVVESHLDLCARCEKELDDLREVSSAMAQPSAIRSVQPAIVTFPQGKFSSLWRLPSFRIPLQAAAALAAVVIVAWLITIPVRRDRAALQVRVAELEKGAAALNEPSGTDGELQKQIAAMREENERLRQVAQSRADVVVALNDGGERITLDSQGNLLGLRAGLPNEQAVKEALLNGRVKLPASLRELRQQSGTLMGGGRAELSLLSPVGIVSESDRPVFRWSALEGAEKYTVTIYDSDLNQVASSDVQTTTWTATAPLPRGGTYIWQVRAIKEGREFVAPPPAGSRIKFKVLERAKVDELNRVKRSHPSSHLVLGLAYAEAGLLEDARREFAALLKSNPQSSIARKLMQSVGPARR